MITIDIKTMINNQVVRLDWCKNNLMPYQIWIVKDGIEIFYYGCKKRSEAYENFNNIPLI